MSKIFFVHQNPDVLEPALRLLKDSGHLAVIYSRGIGASAAIAKELPDLVILDMDRGFIDGGSLCTLLRQNTRLASIPVLLLSTVIVEAELRRTTLSVGAQGCIVATSDPVAFVESIAQYLGRKKPLLPANEAKRMANLQRYRVLETKPEPLFDDLCRIASIVCETPIALMSLVDENRQWFKARVGLDVSETPRDQAFCAHAIHGSEILEVPDATLDARFEGNPLVTKDPHIRFYAGAPLTAPDGTVAGTLCVIDRTPRQLRPPQREALSALSRVATYLLEQGPQQTNG